MIGKWFIEVRDGKLAAQGVIEDAPSPGFWQCRLPGKPTITRLLSSTIVQNFILFDSLNDVEEWMAQRLAPAEKPAEDVPPSPTEEPFEALVVPEPDLGNEPRPTRAEWDFEKGEPAQPPE